VDCVICENQVGCCYLIRKGRLQLKENLLEELNKKIFNMHKDREIVLGDGRAGSPIVLVGEAPGAKEVELKKPFVGQAGKYLQDFLRVLGLYREQLYITNTVKFRPTRKSSKTLGEINRAPSQKEIDEFKQYLFEELEIINPKVIVTLGNVPLKTVTGNENAKVGDLHGKNIKVRINGMVYDIFSLYHPAEVINRRELKEIYYNDLDALKTFLKSKGNIIP